MQIRSTWKNAAKLRGTEEGRMTPEEALRHIKTLIDGSDYLTDPRAMQTLIESIRVLVQKGLAKGGGG